MSATLTSAVGRAAQTAVAVAAHQPVGAQIGQNVDEKLRRDALGLRQVVGLERGTCVDGGEPHHGRTASRLADSACWPDQSGECRRRVRPREARCGAMCAACPSWHARSRERREPGRRRGQRFAVVVSGTMPAQTPAATSSSGSQPPPARSSATSDRTRPASAARWSPELLRAARPQLGTRLG